MGLIYLDTCVVIYAFENDSVFGAEARQALVGAAWALCIEAVVAGLVVLIVKVV